MLSENFAKIMYRIYFFKKTAIVSEHCTAQLLFLSHDAKKATKVGGSDPVNWPRREHNPH
jgi:hypothetical protein